jgi:hypothetical protein
MSFCRCMGQKAVITHHSSVSPCPISKPPALICHLSHSKHTFVKLFQDISKVQFCFIVTVNSNYLMLISYNLLHCQLSSSFLFISQLNVHLFVDIFINLDYNKSVCTDIYFPFVLKNSESWYVYYLGDQLPRATMKGKCCDFKTQVGWELSSKSILYVSSCILKSRIGSDTCLFT